MFCRRLPRHVVAVGIALWLCSLSPVAHAALSISAPASASLGSAPVGTSSRSAQLGTVTVNASGVVAPSFVATVTSTVFTTGAGSLNETIQKTNISYWSGTATSSSGTFTSLTPGQSNAAAAQTLAVPRTAFTGVALALSVAVSWNPTLIVAIPSNAVAGTYTATVTHSVA